MGMQRAWVVRCGSCGGGMMWGLQAHDIRLILDKAFEQSGYLTDFEFGDLDRLCEIEYCTCDVREVVGEK
jgi:hypothetical protein